MKFSYTINETKNNSEDKGFPNHCVRVDMSLSGEGTGDILIKIRDFCKQITDSNDGVTK